MNERRPTGAGGGNGPGEKHVDVLMIQVPERGGKAISVVRVGMRFVYWREECIAMKI